MEKQRIEKIAAGAVNITKVLIIIYLGLVKYLKLANYSKRINTEFDTRKWASQAYSILKTTSGTKSCGSLKFFSINYIEAKPLQHTLRLLQDID